MKPTEKAPSPPLKAYDVYAMWLPLYLHFSTDYDYFKYKGKTTASTKSAYMKRGDKYDFFQLSKRIPKEQMLYYFASNMAHEPMSASQLNSLQAKAVFDRYSHFRSTYPVMAIRETFALAPSGNLPSTFNSDAECPLIIQAHLRGEVSLETIVCLDQLFKIVKGWEGKDDPILADMSNKIAKYSPFIKFDTSTLMMEIRELIYPSE